jgi:hypothetical protein
VVVYCTSVEGHSSIALYVALFDAGFVNVRRYAGGLIDWEAADLALEGDWRRRPRPLVREATTRVVKGYPCGDQWL